MDLDDIKAQLDRIFATRPGPASREEASGLREALVEFKIGINQLKEALTKSEGQLDSARRDAEDYERRGRLAAGIQDTETARIAEEFATKTRERVDLLERKVLVQRDELQLAEREYEITKQRFQAAKMGVPSSAGVPPTSDEDLELSGGTAAGNPPTSPMEEYLMDQRAREAAVEAQLAHLKKKLGEREG